MDSLENLYLDKLEIEYKEDLYDLMLENLKYIHKKIKKNKQNQQELKKLLKILDATIEKLHQKIYNLKSQNYLSNLSKRHYQRYILKIINVYLTYQPKNTKLKELKQKIINDFIKDEKSKIQEIIPYTSQLNELRITFDTNYIEYLIKNRFLPQEEWHKALYFLEAIKLIEPDWTLNKKKLNEIIFEVEKHFENIEPPQKPTQLSQTTKNSYILIDANIFINILKNHETNFFCESNLLLNKINKENKIFITKNILEEIKETIKTYLLEIKHKKEHKNKYNQIENKITKKIKTLEKEYLIEFNLEEQEKNLNKIKQFYSKYILKLRQIFEQKTIDLKISKKLRKLAQREFFLPENTDLMLLVQAIEIQKKFNKQVYIISNDKDLYLFNQPIKEKFQIEILKIEQNYNKKPKKPQS